MRRDETSGLLAGTDLECRSQSAIPLPRTDATQGRVAHKTGRKGKVLGNYGRERADRVQKRVKFRIFCYLRFAI